MKRVLIVSVLLCLACTLQAQTWPKGLPDPCIDLKETQELSYDFLPNNDPVENWNVAYPASLANAADTLDGVVFIVNANMTNNENTHYGVYADIAQHLARQGYLVRTISRPGGGYSTFFVEAKMQETFTAYDLPDDFPVVLIGHSKGGGSVVEVTRLFGSSYEIGAVVSIAPNVENLMGFMGTDAPAFLALYGSQDEDMTGVGGEPREAFMAYDIINTEASTASPVSPLLVVTPNAVDKAMVYVFGADHSGFVNRHGLMGGKFNGRDYLSIDDQFCIAKSYITGFLNWQLHGVNEYRAMFVGDSVPPSVSGISTAEDDYFGNPAGAPVQIYRQFSAKKRFVIANFWSVANLSLDAHTYASPIYPYEIDTRARHYTQALGLHWEAADGFRSAEIEVPNGQRNIAKFDRLLLRIGQIDSGQAEFANEPQQEPIISMSLLDGLGHAVNLHLNNYGPIPWPDRRPNRVAGHSHMATISIPLQDFVGIDLSDVRYVRFWMPPDSKGEVMIDNIEVAYD